MQRRQLCIGVLLVHFAGLCALFAEPARVLVLNPFGRDVEPFSSVVSAFRSTLVREIGEPVDFHEIPLDLARFTGPEGEGPLVDFLEDRIKNHPVDLVVTIGGAGAQFAARHRERLFPATPLLLVASSPRLVPPEFLETNATLVTQEIDLPGMVEDILQMRPETAQIAVVFGASPLESFWASECRREFESFKDRVEFVWLNDLSLDQVVERCSSLPPNSFILNPLFIVDAAGVPSEKNEALQRLHEAANAPLYGYFESEFGLGPIGGRLFQNTKIGTEGARIALRILRGEKPEDIPFQVLGAPVPRYDWRELKKWDFKESRLPVGSRIEFREPTFWERFLWQILGAALLIILQAFLIFGLLVNRARRIRGEEEAALVADISSKFVNLPPDEVDREITEAQRRICEFHDIDLSALWQWSDLDSGSFLATHVYSLEHGPQPPMEMKDDDFPWVRQEILSGRIAEHRSLEEMPAAAAKDRESARQMGIKSHLTLPLAVGGVGALGVLGLNTTRKERSWPHSLIERMQMIAQVFANALARKRADHALRESEERLNIATDSAEAGLWELDLASQTFWANERARVIFGYGPEETIGLEQFEASVHPADGGLVEESIRRAAESGEPVDVEYRIRREDGSERWIASRGRPQLGTSGAPERVLGLSMDITERKRAEQQLGQLSLVVEQSPVLVIITNLQGEIIYVNRKFSEVTGYSSEECIGRNPRLLKSGNSSPLVYEELWAQITSGKTWQGEFHNRKKNGEFYWERALISPLLDSAGTVTHYVGVKEDITEQRQAKQEFMELRDTLAHTDRVTLLGNLASALAHELSQPLGAILRNAEAAEIMLGESDPDWDELKAIVEDILKDDRRAGQVIDKLRSLLKRGSLEMQPLELPLVISEVLLLIQSDASARHIKLASVIPSTLPMIQGDRIHLQQVLLNLLTNAMDAMSEGESSGGVVEVHACLEDATTVEIRVSDNGPGIASEKLGQLFEPFFTTKTTGMGMGLAVSRTIIEAHNGKLWVENGTDGGACFRFTLKVAPEEGGVTSN